MIIAFAGHALVSSGARVKDLVKEEIKDHIADAGSVTCYLGGYGDFDSICAHACRELKEEYPDIEVVYVAPYISLSEQEKMKELQRSSLCDTSLYPPIENVPPRLAIIKRNEWMMKTADLVIVYVNRTYGGAYRSLQVAKRKKKKIINICDFF